MVFSPPFVFGYTLGYSCGLLIGTGAISYAWCCKRSKKAANLKSFGEMKMQVCGPEITHVYSETPCTETNVSNLSYDAECKDADVINNADDLKNADGLNATTEENVLGKVEAFLEKFETVEKLESLEKLETMEQPTVEPKVDPKPDLKDAPVDYYKTE